MLPKIGLKANQAFNGVNILAIPIILALFSVIVLEIGLWKSFFALAGILLVLLILQGDLRLRFSCLIFFGILPWNSLLAKVPFPVINSDKLTTLIVIFIAGVILLDKKPNSNETISSSKLSMLGYTLSITLIMGVRSQISSILYFLSFVLVAATIQKISVSNKRESFQIEVLFSRIIGLYAILTIITFNPIRLILRQEYSFVSANNANPGRLTGFAGDYDALAMLFVIGCLASFFSWTITKAGRDLIAFGAIFVCLLGTGSVTGLMVCTLSLLISGAMYFRKFEKSYFTVIAMLFLVALPLVLRTVVARFTDRKINAWDLVESGSFTKLFNRNSAWEIIETSTSNLGGLFSGSGYPYPLEEIIFWPHNSYIGVLLVFGFIPGIALFTMSGFVLLHKLFNQRSGDFSLFAMVAIATCSVTLDFYRIHATFLLVVIVFIYSWKKPSNVRGVVE